MANMHGSKSRGGGSSNDRSYGPRKHGLLSTGLGGGIWSTPHRTAPHRTASSAQAGNLFVRREMERCSIINLFIIIIIITRGIECCMLQAMMRMGTQGPLQRMRELISEKQLKTEETWN